ncbi:hypothetical protein NKG05_14105 [Oerskovia sp. M15]
MRAAVGPEVSAPQNLPARPIRRPPPQRESRCQAATGPAQNGEHHERVHRSVLETDFRYHQEQVRADFVRRENVLMHWIRSHRAGSHSARSEGHRGERPPLRPYGAGTTIVLGTIELGSREPAGRGRPFPARDLRKLLAAVRGHCKDGRYAAPIPGPLRRPPAAARRHRRIGRAGGRGRPGAILLGADAGVGKSRLLVRAAELAREQERRSS